MYISIHSSFSTMETTFHCPAKNICKVGLLFDSIVYVHKVLCTNCICICTSGGHFNPGHIMGAGDQVTCTHKMYSTVSEYMIIILTYCT